MHTIDLLEEALELASECGWKVRQESLGGVGGGACRLGKQQFLFVDRSLTAVEQLDQVLAALRAKLSTRLREFEDPDSLGLSPELFRCLTK